MNITFCPRWKILAVWRDISMHFLFKISPSHTGLIILNGFITLKNDWMNPCVKTEWEGNESVNNEFKIMKKSN